MRRNNELGNKKRVPVVTLFEKPVVYQGFGFAIQLYHFLINSSNFKNDTKKLTDFGKLHNCKINPSKDYHNYTTKKEARLISSLVNT